MIQNSDAKWTYQQLIRIALAASTIMTNHDPRMNRISSIVLVELPPNTACIRRYLVHELPPVLDMIV
jgi:hypothetical protein